MKAEAGCKLGIDKIDTCHVRSRLEALRVWACSNYRTEVSKQDVKRAEKVIVKEVLSEIASIHSMSTKENAEKYF